MPTIVATAGASNANSYNTVDGVTTLLDEMLNVSTWASAVLVDRERAVITATWLIDTSFDWEVTKVSDTQALIFPATANRTKANAETLSTLTIPTFIKRAHAYLSNTVLVKDRLVDVSWKGISEIRSGSQHIVFDKVDREEMIPEFVHQLIAPYGIPFSSSQGRVERV